METITSDELSQEHESLSYGARLHWFHWAILVLSGVVTIAAWYFSKTQLEDKTRAQFDREATQVVELVSERMRKYEDALWAGVAAIRASDDNMGYAEWHAFAASLHIDTKYPGISGIGVVANVQKDDLADHIESVRRTRPDYRVHPEHAQPDLFPIIYIEPEAPNAKAVGLDMAHELNRYTAAKNARDTGKAQITGPIFLVQDEGRTPGFLFYAPFYRDGTYEAVSERQDRYLGMVYAPFIVNRLMAGTLEKGKRYVGIQLTDGKDVLYDEHHVNEDDYDPTPLFTQQLDVEAYGRTWTFDIRSGRSFRVAAESNQPTFILAGGITIDLLLLALFLMLSRANRNTLSYAERTTVELQRQAKELAKSNAELESFAYVTSHDLKTPLRGIADLASYIEEDLSTYLKSPDCHSDVGHNIGRLHQQVDRMDSLIRGILDYSGVGIRPETVELFKVQSILDSIRNELNIRDDQIISEGAMPTLTTYRVRFEQVMTNLIGNAFKYHQDKSNASVHVSSQEKARFFEFSVTDNGPGIDPKFHSRIFEVFQTLQSKDEIESSGVGLSIVKKSVEGLGGRISVSSELGKGTTFRFEWPKNIPTQQQIQREVI